MGYTGGFHTTLWGVSQGVSTYNLASRVTRFFAKVSRPLSAPTYASGGFGAGRPLTPPPQKSERHGFWSALVTIGSRHRKSVISSKARGSEPQIDGAVGAPEIAQPGTRSGPRQRQFGAQWTALHVAASCQNARGRIESPWAMGSSQRPPRSLIIDQPRKLQLCARWTAAAVRK